MIPTVRKLVDDVAQLIEKPAQSAAKFVIKEGGKKAAGAAINRIKPVNERIADFKSRNVTNDDDVATIAAITDILYEDLLKIRVNNNPLYTLTEKADLKSFNLSYLVRENVVADDKKLHDTVSKIRSIRIIFKDIIPQCATILGFAKYMDVKSLAGKMTSMAAADVMLVKDTLDTCKRGVQVCDKGLSWAGQYDKVINEWLSAHKASHAT